MPLLVAAIAVLLGIVCGQWMNILLTIVLGSISIAALGVGLWVNKKLFSPTWEWISTVLIFLTCFFVGNSLFYLGNKEKISLPFDAEKEVALVGIVSSDVKSFAKNSSCQMTTIGYWEAGKIIPWKTQLMLRTDSSFQTKIEKHDSVFITAKIVPLKSKNEGYLRYLNRNGIYYTAYTKSVSLGQKHRNVLTKIEAIQSHISHQFLRLMPDSTMAGIANAMFLGEMEYMNSDINLDYKNTGTSHILSISGQHIAVIFMLLNLMFIPLEQIKGGKRAKNILILGLLVIYMLLCGAGASVVRSVAMFVIILIAKLLRKRYHILNLLGFAALIQMLWEPMVIYNLGFQLSYCAVASIVIFYPMFEKLFLTKHTLLNHVFSWIGVTLTAQILTFPIILFNFGTFPTYFLLTNVLLAPIAQVTVFCGFIFLLVCYIPLLGTIFAYITYAGLWLMTAIVHKIALLPYPVIDKLNSPGIAILFATLAITIILLYLPKWFSKEKSADVYPEGLNIWGLD